MLIKRSDCIYTFVGIGTGNIIIAVVDEATVKHRIPADSLSTVTMANYCLIAFARDPPEDVSHTWHAASDPCPTILVEGSPRVGLEGL